MTTIDTGSPQMRAQRFEIAIEVRTPKTIPSTVEIPTSSTNSQTVWLSE